MQPTDPVAPTLPAEEDRRRQVIDLTAKRKVEGTRLDQYLVSLYPDYSRSVIKKVIDAAAVMVNGQPAKASYKVRHGDRKVAVSAPDLQCWRGHTPVVVDDIISTAGTMIATIRQLRRARLAPPICVAVHAVFADGAYDELRRAGVARVVTCNTIAHPSNAIDVTAVVAAGVAGVLGGRTATGAGRIRRGAGQRRTTTT